MPKGQNALEPSASLMPFFFSDFRQQAARSCGESTQGAIEELPATMNDTSGLSQEAPISRT